jgi:hypothetical protein
MTNRTRLIAFCMALGWMVGIAAAQDASLLTLVADGQPKAVIRFSESPVTEVKFAAGELQTYIERISGARLELSAKGQPAIDIAVDDSLRPRLGEDGFVVRIDASGVRLRGATGVATVYAVYTFCEEQLGCRWFFPLDLGEDIPQQKTIRLTAFEKEYRPSFRFRSIGGVNHGGWDLKNRLSEGLKIQNRTYSKVWGVAHTFYRLLPMEEYWEKHPEYYSFNRGKRSGPVKRPTHGPNICTSNPDAIREVARRIGAMFDRDPYLIMITLGPNDGLQYFCECDTCRALDEPGKEWRGPTQRSQWRGQLSRRLMIFYNEVARLVRKSHPDRLLKIMVYSWYQEPPTDKSLVFEDNILTMLTHSGNPSNYEKLYPSCYNHPLTDPTCRPNRERFVPALKGWAERSKRLGIYEYYCKASVCETMFPIVHTIRHDLPYYHSQGVEYFYTQGKWRNAGAIGLNYYVTAKLLWDVNTDVDAVLADFYTRYYREAAAPMKRFHEFMEESMAKRGGDVLGWLFHLPKVLDNRTVMALGVLLDEAGSLAQSELVRKRIALTQTYLDYTLFARSLWAEVEEGYRAERSGEVTDEAAAQKRLAARILPYQNAIRDYIAGHDDLQWMKPLGNNYQRRLLAPGMAKTYETLLPAE